MADSNPNNGQAIPEREIKQNSGVSASMALQATQKAWDLRQAANAAGDPNAREEILAKAINKEIEAESFGKAAKYTQSGAFQGLAAGAGLGVQPGVTLGKVTGAIVGGTVSTVTGLLGGGIGSVYGAMNGPMWNLGEMASHGVRGVIGDFPNWKSTPAQKKALEKMVMQSKETQAPTEEELEKMKADAPDDAPQSWSQSAQDMTSWRPSMPSMPNMPSMAQGGAALGLGGLGASMPSWGGKDKAQDKPQQSSSKQAQTQKPKPKPRTEQPSKQGAQSTQQAQRPQQASKPKEAPAPKAAPKSIRTSQPQKDTSEAQPSKPKPVARSNGGNQEQKSAPSTDKPKPEKLNTTSTRKPATSKPEEVPAKSPPKLRSQRQTSAPGKENQVSSNASKENKPAAVADGEKKKPRKLAPRGTNSQASPDAAPKRAPRKLARNGAP